MRALNRNKQTVWWASYLSKTEILDEYDNPTGQYQITYSTPRKANWNVSYVESDAEVQMFGIHSKDALRIVADKKGFSLNESSILWFGKNPPSPYSSTSPKHNYAIAGIRPSLNEMVFYAKRVDAS